MKREAVSLLGLAVLLSSFLLADLRIKPNRVAEGWLLSLWELGGAVPWLMAGLVALALAAGALIVISRRGGLAGRGGDRRLTARLTVASAMIPLVVALLAAGTAAALAASDLPAGRVGPGAGWWAAALGAYTLYYDGRRRLAGAGSSAEGRAAWPFSAGIVAASIVVVAVLPLNGLGVVQEFTNRSSRFWEELGAHLVLSGASVFGAVLIGVPLGMLAFRWKRAVRPVFTVTSGLQTIPSLALFGLMIAPLALLSQRFPFLRTLGIRGVGNAPAIIALTLYGLLPIVRNTFVGLKSIDQAVVEAGRGMGMSRAGLLRMVQIPIALPIILTGLRITAVQTVGNAAVAALIGARGLGNFVFQGLGQAAPDLIVLGALPIVVLAVVVDRGMDALIRVLRPGP